MALALVLLMALEFAHGAIQWLAADAATTVYTVSGLTFQPKAIRFYWMGLQSSTDAASEAVDERRGMGFATGTSARRCIGTFSDDTAATSACASFAADDCVVGTVDVAGTRDGELDLNSITSDGFTLIVDDQGVANITVFYEAWGGSDIVAVGVGDFAEPSSISTTDQTVTGFTAGALDEVVFVAFCQSTAAINSTFVESSGFHVGISTAHPSSPQDIGVMGHSDHASAAMDTDGKCGAALLAMVAVAGSNTTNMRAFLSSYIADGFRLDWFERAVTGRKGIYLGIKGGSWRAGSYTIDGGTGSATATVSGLPFKPKGICLMGRMTTENTGNTCTVNDRIGLGCGTSTSSRRAMGILDEDATASSNCEIDAVLEYDQVLAFPSTAGALQSAYDINAMNQDGFQIIVDTAGGVASEWQGYLAFGDQVLPAPRRAYTVSIGA